ncbi:MAG TPA: serine hydrolase [Candidatus Eisenbacteria bacterium]|nr:serine hydrolase [Candidatus Eisenbacteria bacterium]
MQRKRSIILVTLLLICIFSASCFVNDQVKENQDEKPSLIEQRRFLEENNQEVNSTTSREYQLDSSASKTKAGRANESQIDPLTSQREVVIARKNELDLKDLENKIETYLDQQKIDRSSLSVYVTDLTRDQEYCFNETVFFGAASIYKLPIAMLFYDDINKGEISFDTNYVYEASYHQAGGPIPYTYNIGDEIPLDQLLNDMIEFSDNTSAWILYHNYGGWEVHRTEALRYTNYQLGHKFLAYENYMTSQYTNDLLLHIYNHQNEYALLLESMKNSFPENYLNLNCNNSTYQKHGNYLDAMGGVGLVLDGNPYAISILTSLGNCGEIHLGNINKIVYHHFNP